MAAQRLRASYRLAAVCVKTDRRDLSAWVDKTLSAAIWTQRFARQQARNAELGLTEAWLADEYAALQARRASG